MTEPKIFTEGKTKVITEGPEPGLIVIETKDELTAGDAARRSAIPTIAKEKTAQAAHVFQLLREHGIPVAFRAQIDPVKLLCEACDMVPLECVIRRYAWGSMLKREPSLASGGTPHRFERPRPEFFHKWSVCVPPAVSSPVTMPEGEARARYLKNGKWEEGVYTDPLAVPGVTSWSLYGAKEPTASAKPLIVIPPVLSEQETDFVRNSLMVPAFLALEEAWSRVRFDGDPVALVDIKLEVGRRQSDGALVIADVIDNDSWRIWPGANPKRQLDKQGFREGDSDATVLANYRKVTGLTGTFTSISGG